MPIPESNLLDFASPPPLRSRLTIQWDHTVLSLPSPRVQSTPQEGAFVLRGQIEAMSYSVVVPA